MEPKIDHYLFFEKELKRRREIPTRSISYKIVEKISIEEAILRLKNDTIISKRFSNVLRLGECCVDCGKKRSYVALGKDNGNSLHWDLYAEDGTMMTIDHILPKSKGGKDIFENYQLMCSPCNHKKDNYIDIEQVNQIVSEILETPYETNENSERLILQYLKEVGYRQNSFIETSNQFLQNKSAFYLHLRIDEAKALRKLNPYMVKLFNEFIKRVEKENVHFNSCKGAIDYEIGKVYILKD